MGVTNTGVRVRNRAICITGAAILALGAISSSLAAPAPASNVPVLPPATAWSGKSRALIARPADPWITPSEAAQFATTPRYADTVRWLSKLCDASPDLEMISLGRSPEGRDLWMVVAARGGGTSPAAVRAARRPVVLAQAGIHAGEIDGKDAGMMLLRDLLPGRRLAGLLDEVTLLFVPIFNVDGHERFSAFTRINQRGPQEAGWRTTARNLNLNRDYTKLDAPEMRAMVQALVQWDPELYIDLHVTDGADYQYDVTWGYNGAAGWSPAIRQWLNGALTPAIRGALTAQGHVPGPFVWPLDDDDLSKGIVEASTTPRLSNGYGDARHLPAMLVENHSLKPYEQRVLGTYVLLEAALRVVGHDPAGLRQAIATDRAGRAATIPLDWKWPTEPGTRTMSFKGIHSRRVPSVISGGVRVDWRGLKDDVTVPIATQTEPVAEVRRPRAYWIPAAWADLGERLARHGIQFETQTAAREIEVEMYRVTAVKLDSVPFEGHVRVTPRVDAFSQRRTFAPGSLRVSTDQPLGTLAVLLLEPQSPDSFLQWGFLNECLQQTEYVEGYIMEPMAERMLAESAPLRAEFERRLSDPEFAAHPQARLEWFYRRTPFYDAEARLYPVGRE